MRSYVSYVYRNIVCMQVCVSRSLCAHSADSRDRAWCPDNCDTHRIAGAGAGAGGGPTHHQTSHSSPTTSSKLERSSPRHLNYYLHLLPLSFGPLRCDRVLLSRHQDTWLLQTNTKAWKNSSRHHLHCNLSAVRQTSRVLTFLRVSLQFLPA